MWSGHAGRRLKVDFDVGPNGAYLKARYGKTIGILRSKSGSHIELPSVSATGDDGALKGTFTQRIIGVGAMILHRVDSLTDAEEADIDAVDLDAEAAAVGKVIHFCHFLVGQSTARFGPGQRWVCDAQGLGLFFLRGRDGRRTCSEPVFLRSVAFAPFFQGGREAGRLAGSARRDAGEPLCDSGRARLSRVIRSSGSRASGLATWRSNAALRLEMTSKVEELGPIRMTPTSRDWMSPLRQICERSRGVVAPFC